MEIKIPTRTIEIGKKENPVTIEVYEYLTAEQEEKKNNLLFGDREIEIGKTDQVTMSVKMSALSQLNKFLVDSLCVNIKWADFNVMKPELRQELITKLNDIVNVDVKKK